MLITPLISKTNWQLVTDHFLDAHKKSAKLKENSNLQGDNYQVDFKEFWLDFSTRRSWPKELY